MDLGNAYANQACLDLKSAGRLATHFEISHGQPSAAGLGLAHARAPNSALAAASVDALHRRRPELGRSDRAPPVRSGCSFTLASAGESSPAPEAVMPTLALAAAATKSMVPSKGSGSVVPRPNAVVSFYGYGDITGDWYAKPDAFYNLQPPVTEAEAGAAVGMTPLSEPDEATSARRLRYYLWTRQHGMWPGEVTGRDPATERKAFAKWCPVRNVTAGWPPTLLLHGTADADVPYAQSAQMFDALTPTESAHRLNTVKDGPHAFDRGVIIADMKSARRTPVAQACADSAGFLSKWLESD